MILRVIFSKQGLFNGLLIDIERAEMDFFRNETDFLK